MQMSKRRRKQTQHGKAVRSRSDARIAAEDRQHPDQRERAGERTAPRWEVAVARADGVAPAAGAKKPGRILVGMASWTDPGFVADWYPGDLPAKQRLTWYAEHFNLVE